MDRKDQRLTAAGLLVAAAFVLSGCGEDEPEPRVENRPSQVESPAAVEEAETADEFIRRWFLLSAEMQNTGKTQEFLEVSQGCDTCSELADQVTEYYSNGGYVRAEPELVKRVEPYKESTKTFRVRTVVDPTEYKASETSSVQALSGGRNTYLLTLQNVRDGWRVTHLVLEAS